jgi:hypothetical protein
VRHLPLPRRRLAAVGAEGRRLLRFLGAGGRDVQLVELSP